MQIANCKLKIGPRRGGVYIAVLGSSLIVALLGIAALSVQRVQNRIVTSSVDIRQAQLNAHAAVELAQLIIRTDPEWRTNYPHGRWFTNRATGDGSCSLDVLDPLDADLANNPNDPVILRGIGTRGQAEQLVEVTLDPRRTPYSILSPAIAAGGTISLQNCTLRTTGRTTANQVSASASQVYGSVEATTISGATYHGATTQVAAAELPAMPDWSALFAHYRAAGIATEISYNSLPASPTSNSWGFARNWSVETGTEDWTGTPPGLPTASISQSNNWKNSGNFSLRVTNRNHWSAGAAQHIEHFVKPGQQYDVSAWVYANSGFPPLLLGTSNRDFHLTLFVKGTGDSNPLPSNSVSGSATCLRVLLTLSYSPGQITGRVTAPQWNGDLEYAYVKISDATNGSTAEFWVDDLRINEVTSGRYIYRRVLGPGINPFGAANAQGLYWINCNGNRITIERSRIVGTLLLVNPGPGSSIAHGPINWTPAVAGYPALLIDNDGGSFRIAATRRALSETEQRVNYNPAGAPYEQLGMNTTTTEIYPSMIRGLVAVRGNLVYANRPLIQGHVLVGRNLTSLSGELEVEHQPTALLSPPPGFWQYAYPRRPGSVRKAVQ